MRLIRVSLAAVLALGVAASVPAFAQHDGDHDRDRDSHEHEKDSRHGHGQGHAYGHDKDRDWHEDHGRHEGHFRHEEFEHHHRMEEIHYRERFGREHHFRVERIVVVEGHPRFQHGGYWFVMGRPLPPGWRQTDEVYVERANDGYYMCSPVHPGIRISINIL